jgi:antitoxin component of MazEF toxin-antitoxin module
MARTKEDRTKLIIVRSETNSLRTTIPSSIVRQMKLNVGDELEWQIESLQPAVIKVTIIRSNKN